MTRIGLTLTLALVLGLGSYGNAGAAYVWHQWKASDGGNNHRYALTENSNSWVAAETEALNAGGQLVIIDNAEENTWLDTTFNGWYWIGLNCPEGGYTVTSNWKWVDGSSTDNYSNWDSGQPDSGIGGADRYGSIHLNGHWHNVPNAGWTDGQGIIELVPLPAAFCLLGSGLIGLVVVRRRFRP